MLCSCLEKRVIALIMKACTCRNRPWYIKLTLTAFKSSSAFRWRSSQSKLYPLIHYSNLHPSLLDWAQKRFIKSHFRILDHISFVTGWAEKRKNMTWLASVILITYKTCEERDRWIGKCNFNSFLEDYYTWIFDSLSSLYPTYISIFKARFFSHE